ncbi:MAG TPA: hypothetical protein VKZ60_20415 [Chloroflexota bacterium]|jgi:hypothetical protein|nr:hypothetical protein [Chloroflexota bacterium]
MTKRSGLLAVFPALLLALAACALPAGLPFQAAGPAFEFGLIGDIPYTPEEEAQFPALIADLNAANLAFVVHDGDIKAGDTECSDAQFAYIHGMFQTFRHPLIYVPGDNEWTDCHRENNGSYDPLERLAALRALFFPTNASLGQRTLPLLRQSATPAYAAYRENVRWHYGEVTFVGLHVVGSNNNLGRTPEMDAEYAARNAANLAWLAESFADARARDSRAIMLIIQANPYFERRPDQRTGFNDFLGALEAETIAFRKPVVLVHGDSHYFRIDKPLVRSTTGRMIENFTRVETFATPYMHWVRVVVDYSDPNVFVFHPKLVEANLANHQP